MQITVIHDQILQLRAYLGFYVAILLKIIFLQILQQQSLIADAEVPAGAITEEEEAAAAGSTVALNGGLQKAATDGDLEVGSGTYRDRLKGGP